MNKPSVFRFPVFLVISLAVHSLLIAYGLYNYREQLANALSPTKKQLILVDLTDPRNDLSDPNNKVVSRYSYRGKGKLSPKPGQHLPGALSPVTLPESSSLRKPGGRPESQSMSKEKSISGKILRSDQGEAVLKDVEGREGRSQRSALVTEKDEMPSKDKRRLAVDTEDSLDNKFWFDESELLQISASAHPDAEFSLELFNLFKKRFATYVLGGGAINFYYVKPDQATVLATINSAGKIRFEKMVNSSSTQPYMNYLVSRVVDNPGIVKKLPPELRGGRNQELHFLFNIRFTGEPLRKWWFSFEFLPQNRASK